MVRVHWVVMQPQRDLLFFRLQQGLCHLSSALSITMSWTEDFLYKLFYILFPHADVD